MRLYLDNQYPPGLIAILQKLNDLQPYPVFEIVHRDWDVGFTANDTVAFLINLNKKAIDPQILAHYRDGFRVFIIRKPYDEAFSPYEQAIRLLTHWRNIIRKISKEQTAFIYSINDKQLKKIK